MWPMLIFSHILGDYYLQGHKMAINKSSSTFFCGLHSLIYSLCILIPLTIFYPIGLSFGSGVLLGVLIFYSHYIIDRYSLAAKYIQLKGGPEIDHPFYSVIYVAIDNGAHLFLMWMILRFMGFPI